MKRMNYMKYARLIPVIAIFVTLHVCIFLIIPRFNSWSSSFEPAESHVLDFVKGTKLQKQYVRKIHVISNIVVGGALKYVKDIESLFPDVQFVYIRSLESLRKIKFQSHDLVFINHLIRTDISPNDILSKCDENAFKLVCVVHDFHWTTFVDGVSKPLKKTIEFKTHGNYLSHDLGLDPSVVTLFKRSDAVIHQAQFSFDVFSKFYKGANSVIQHPNDYEENRRVQHPVIVHDTINIGALLGVSNYKGKELVEILQKQYTKYRQYKVVFKIAGVNIPRYDDSQESFNAIIEAEHIHGLLYLGKWAETYSYALTKYINSGLPILYNRFGALRQRLEGMKDTFVAFEREQQVVEALANYEKKTNTNGTNIDTLFKAFESFLDHLIRNARDSTYIFPSKPITARPFYKDLFLPYQKDSNLVIVTSKLSVSSRGFSYTPLRSMYSLKERYTQTLNTLESIRHHIPNSYIVLIDNSQNLPVEYVKTLRQKVDVMVDHTTSVLNWYTDVGPYKALAELAQLLSLYNSLLKHLDMSRFRHVFKITGRYTLVPEFSMAVYDQYPHDHVFKRDAKLTHLKYFFTCFYKIAPGKFHSYFDVLRRIFLARESYIQRKYLNLEEMIPAALRYDFQNATFLGVRQNVAVWNDTLVV